MLTEINPKLPMKSKALTQDFYINHLGFQNAGNIDHDHYLMVRRDMVEIHFFLFENLDLSENYGQVYIRTNDIRALYHSLLESKIVIHPNGQLDTKPWGQTEFSILDPNNNLLTFGQESIN